MKLTGQASQYWTNVESMIPTSESYRDLKDKHVPASYYDRLLDSWQWFTQGTKSVMDCVAQFDVFLIHCNTLGTESDT